ncbi:MAG: ArnT family glycosyltransferase [Anaerolineae bacterium]
MSIAAISIVYLDAYWNGIYVLSVFFGLWAVIILALRDDDESVYLIAYLLLILTGVLIRLYVTVSGFVWTDEGFHLSAAAGMLSGGTIAPAMMFLPQNIPLPPWRGIVFGLYKGWASLFGLGLPQMRLLAFLLGLLSLPLTFDAIRRLISRKAAWAGLVFFTGSSLFMLSHTGRNDSLIMLLVSGVLWVFAWAWSQEKWWAHALVGVSAVFALEGHFAAASFLVTFGGVYAADYLVQAVSARKLIVPAKMWGFLSTVLPLTGLYVCVHIFSLPSGGALSTADAFLPERNLLLAQVDGFMARVQLWAGYTLLEPTLLLAAMIVAGLRRRLVDWLVLGLVGFTAVGYLLLGTDPSVMHTLYGLPVYAVGVARLFDEDEDESLPVRQWALLLIALLMLGTQLRQGRLASEARDYFADEYAPIVESARAHTDPGEAIITPPVFVPFLIDHTTLFLHNYEPGVLRGPALAGEPPAIYWQRILLETWPAVYIAPYQVPNDALRIQQQYMEARSAQEVVEHVYVVDDGLLAPGPYFDVNSDAPLQIVAHAPPNDESLHTLWVSRGELPPAIPVVIETMAEGSVRSETTILSTVDWATVGIHAVELRLPVPAESRALVLRIDAPLSVCGSNCEVLLHVP